MSDDRRNDWRLVWNAVEMIQQMSELDFRDNAHDELERLIFYGQRIVDHAPQLLDAVASARTQDVRTVISN